MRSGHLIRPSELNAEDMERMPIWEYVDDSDTLLEAEFLSPLIIDDVIPNDTGDLLIRATFETPHSRILIGYVVDEGFVAMGLFVQGKGFTFNRLAPERARQDAEEIKKVMGWIEDLFPLTFRTGLHYPGCDELTGVFDPFRQG